MTYSTEQRNILLSFLKTNPDTMFSPKQIEEALAMENISRSAVYRNLAALEAEQKIKRCTKTGCKETFYQFFDLAECKNHIHLSCTACGKIFHMENKIAETLVSQVVTKEGFQINKGETTLYGLCKNCALETQ